MNWQPFQNWLSHTNLFIVGVCLFGAMCLAALAGAVLKSYHRAPAEAGAEREAHEADKSAEGGEGYIVSAVLGLLALLLGFTFSLAVDRFDARRILVLDEANAIGTAYLRAQLLAEPDRARMSGLLIRYTDNRIALAKAKPGRTAPLLAVNDALLTDLWAATNAAFENIKALPFSNTYLDSVNHLIDLDASRKTARLARVPPEVFMVLFIYMAVTAGVLGYALRGTRSRIAGVFLFALLTLSLMLILDIDRPVLGGIMESQRPMEDLRASFAAPPSVFDKYKATPAAQAPPP